MNKLKPFKWASTLFHNYENKEYKERHFQVVHKEYAIINALSNIINNPDLFSKKEVEEVKKHISSFHISHVEKEALFKIISEPYPINVLRENINKIADDTKEEIFYSISDIFISKNRLSEKENLFINEMMVLFDYNSKTKNKLLRNLKKSYQELKSLLNQKTSGVTRQSICKDICLSEYKNFVSVPDDKNKYFESKKGIIGSIIFTASLVNIDIDIPTFLLVLWAPSILYKTNLKKASYVSSSLTTIYKRYEKIIDWNIVNLDRLLTEYVKDQCNERTSEDVKSFSVRFASKVVNHIFMNDEHRKISKFQRSLKN